MKNAGEFLIGAGIALLVGYGIWRATRKNVRVVSNRKDADTIFMEAFGKPSNPSYGDDYVFAWATALLNKKSDFELNGKTYSSKTGKQIA